MKCFPLARIGLLPVLLATTSAFAAGRPVIESIQGDKIVIVITKEGNRPAGRGTEINVGDRIKTGPRASAKIVYPDGSRIFVARNSEIQIEDNEKGTQWNNLVQGEVRGVIKKPKALNEAKGPPRFGIRTRAAVMGVRGTDFVLGAPDESAKMEVRTLEGLVEVAKDESTLMSGEGVLVEANKFTTATQDWIAPPKEFDSAEYVQSLGKSQPEFVELARRDEEVQAREKEMKRGPALKDPEIKDGDPYGQGVGIDGGKKPVKRFRLGQFQVGGVHLWQGEKGGPNSATASATSVQVSWNPTWDLMLGFSLRGHFALVPIRENRAGDYYFVSIESAGIVSWNPLWGITGEVGFGRTGWWHNRARPGNLFMMNAAWKFRNVESGLERVYVGLSHLDLRKTSGDGLGTGELRAGIGWQF